MLYLLYQLVSPVVTSPSHEQIVLSNICGSLSLACWVILLLPQLLEQWRLKSADGLAIGFVTAWFLGDLANLIGAVWGQLRPNVILLALWFCFSDSLLILSYLYYTRGIRFHEMFRSTDAEAGPSDVDEQSPLVPVRSDVSTQASEVAEIPSSWLVSTALPMAIVLVIATVSYAISDNTPEAPQSEIALGPAILGYVSALFYIVARIPQIIQNHRRKSVEGLSIGFFLLSMVGNLTYGGQILIYRSDSEWLTTYMPWLIGSLGTIIEDSIIFAQFFLYRRM